MKTRGRIATLERFRRHVGLRLGLLLEGSLEETLEQLLHRRTKLNGLVSEEAYLSRLESGLLGPREEQELATQLTVGETYFFRNAEHFAAFSERAVPEWLETRRGTTPLRILSAGCATGEEPYSLAMLIAKEWPRLEDQVEITGIDLDTQSLARAEEGVYTRWSLRAIAASYRRRYFETQGDRFVLSPDIRRRVRFEARNLAEDNSDLLAPASFDVIFCRNVIIYLRLGVTRELIRRFSQALAPGGFLFLGHTESLRGISRDFSVEHTHGTFYYRRLASKAPAAPTGEVPPSPVRSHLGSFPGRPDAQAAAGSGATPRVTRDGEAPSTREATAEDRSRIFELLRLERLEEALTLAERSVRDGGSDDVEAMTVLAVLLTNRGDVERARAACHAILALDSLHAGAHYLLALCAELEGALDRAQEHDETAVHLDPGFAMAHLHLGRLALHEGDSETAAEHLERAESLLEITESSQLLLYGGGFRREALIALCRAQLRGLESES
ncbi:MAG: tetratricopeptide repeat protein [Acidobacteria bacterium]|nr:tetratricopeptide repeat protein [Acidobacteriota bacterium]